MYPKQNKVSKRPPKFEILVTFAAGRCKFGFRNKSFEFSCENRRIPNFCEKSRSAPSGRQSLCKPLAPLATIGAAALFDDGSLRSNENCEFQILHNARSKLPIFPIPLLNFSSLHDIINYVFYKIGVLYEKMDSICGGCPKSE